MMMIIHTHTPVPVAVKRGTLRVVCELDKMSLRDNNDDDDDENQ